MANHLLAKETSIVGITESTSLKMASNLCTSLQPIITQTYNTQMEVDSKVASKACSPNSEEDGKPCKSPCKTIGLQLEQIVDLPKLKAQFGYSICLHQNVGLDVIKVRMINHLMFFFPFHFII
jgi:hypothetical protein